jgi:glutamate-1-semialdehyde 2,1-aminomutase
MSSATIQRQSPTIPSYYDPRQFRVTDLDRELFNQHLASFVPSDAFDVHGHWYDMRIFDPNASFDDFEGPTWVGSRQCHDRMSQWMGALAPKRGLFFPMPVRRLDVDAANVKVLEEADKFPDNRCLLMITRACDPAVVERQVKSNRTVAGFKVYHLFAERPDTQNCVPEEYIPRWAWELADKYSLSIMLHMVMKRSLAEKPNQDYIRECCIQFPNARLILAHSARGFCGRHTVEGIESLRGLGNVYFDNSVSCEPEAVEAIIGTFGATRLMYGSDFPLSEARGRAINLGDGYHWIYETDWTDGGSGVPTLVGLESLLALKQACRRMNLRDSDVERIFRTNAHDLLGIRPRIPEGQGTGQALYREARKIIPGGTQLVSKRPEMYAPGRWPAYFSESRGCEVFDLDGRRYVDFATTGIGACLLGHGHPDVTSAVLRRVQLGSMSTLNSPEEIEMGRLLIGMHPWSDKIRLARAGGEALSIAVRIARAGTGREVIAFCGYHGWSDWYLAANLGDTNALSGHLLSGLSPHGVPQSLRGTAMPFNFNQIDGLREIVRQHGSRLAAVVMEPTRSVLPAPGFLEDVRQICNETGARLIFDEVTTGFRFHLGGVHLQLGVMPDMAVFAKSLGNGHPIAAIIGNSASMDAAEDSFISSTYWTEGVGPTAGVATLKVMKSIDVPAHVKRIGTLVREGLGTLATSVGVPMLLSGHPAQCYLAFDHPQADALMTLYIIRMLDRGYLTGSAFYPTLAHQDHHVCEYLSACEPVFAEIAQALRQDDVKQRIEGNVKHSGFRRLN